MTNAETSPRFFVKSFFAKSIQDAMSQARLEMGPDALLLDTKPAPPEARHLGEYEVVFGEYAEDAPVAAPAAGPKAVEKPAVGKIAETESEDRLGDELDAGPDTEPDAEPAYEPAPSPFLRALQARRQPAAKPPAAKPAAAAPIAEPAPRPTPARPIAIDAFAGVRRTVEEIRSLLSDGCDPKSPSASQRMFLRVSDELAQAGVELHLAREIAEAVRNRMQRRSVLDISRARTAEWDDAGLAQETQAEIAKRCPVQPEIGAITALVGPPGAGKTTTLIKLAISQGLALGKPIGLVSVDTHRVGGAAQLETYASLLDVPFQAADSPGALAEVIEYAPEDALLFIDTPGYSAKLFADAGAEVAGVLARRQEVDTHLVLTASMRPEALRQAADLYGAFRPSKLLFTHLDEASSYATILCEAARRDLPLSFFATGQSIPEDLEPASVRRIADSLVKQLPKAMQATA